MSEQSSQVDNPPGQYLDESIASPVLPPNDIAGADNARVVATSTASNGVAEAPSEHSQNTEHTHSETHIPIHDHTQEEQTTEGSSMVDESGRLLILGKMSSKSSSGFRTNPMRSSSWYYLILGE